jgi:hypothetical protein
MFLGDFLGPTVDDEIQAWNLTPHSGVWFFTNLPSGIRKSAPRRLGLDFLDSSSSLTLFGPSTSPHPFLAVSAPFTVPHRSDLQPSPKTKSPSPHSLLSFIVSPLSIRVIIIFGGKRRAHDDRIIDKTCIFLKCNSTYFEHSHCQRAISCTKLRFLVYSPKGQVHIKVQQNKNVLMTIISNIQWFNFTYFVQ